MVLVCPVDLGTLAQFLVRARSHGYAGGAKKVANPQRPGFKEFPPFQEEGPAGVLEYVDSYAGHYFAPGQEVVRLNSVPIWHMAYSGGMLPDFHGDKELAHETFQFLKMALSYAPQDRPFRGPDIFKDGKFDYYNDARGTLADFYGTERIFRSVQAVFRQRYIGGLFVHKEQDPYL